MAKKRLGLPAKKPIKLPKLKATAGQVARAKRILQNLPDSHAVPQTEGELIHQIRTELQKIADGERPIREISISKKGKMRFR
jgi:hypothetical protein